MFSNMLSMQHSCDIEFVVEGERFPAHRIVVASASAPFSKLLMGGMKEATSKEIHIREISKDAWRLVQKFIYSGRIIFETMDDALNVARFAYMYDMKELFHLVERYIIEHFQDIYQEDGFKLLPFEMVDRLTSSQMLKVISELDVLKAILSWADLSDLHEDNGDNKPKQNEDTGKYEDVKKLLVKVDVEEMEPWEVEVAWSFRFIRHCPKTADALMKRLLSVSVEGKENYGIKPFACGPIYRHELPWSSRRFTFFFKIMEWETPNGAWECKDKINSPWETDERTDRKWRLQVHLEGRGNSDGKHISVFIELNSNSTSHYELEKIQIFLLHNSRAKDPHFEEGYAKWVPGTTRGFRDFVPTDTVFKESSNYLSHNRRSLTFGASIFYDDDS